MRVCICETESQATGRLVTQETDAAIIYRKDNGTCLIYFLGLRNDPEPTLQTLPGYRPAGVQGISWNGELKTISSYAVARKAEEVHDALTGNTPLDIYKSILKELLTGQNSVVPGLGSCIVAAFEKTLKRGQLEGITKVLKLSPEMQKSIEDQVRQEISIPPPGSE